MTREEFLGTLAAVEAAVEKWYDEAQGFLPLVHGEDTTAVNNILINIRALRFKFEKRYGPLERKYES